MERRNFIKNALCLGCLGVIGSGCSFNTFTSLKKDLKSEYDKFIYKSKEDLPKKVHLEACSLCQLDCPECATRRVEKYAPKDWLGYLKFENFKKLVDEYQIEEIYLSNNGEIFLNPELDEIIKYAHKKQIKLDASVNFNQASDVTIENLVKYQFTRLKVALDGATPETYKIYRRGGDFNKVIENIKKINYFKEKYNSEFPKLTWQFILFGHSEHEIELAKQKACELNMDIKFKRNAAPKYSPVKNPKLVEKQTDVKIFDESKKPIINRRHNMLEPACNLLFNSPQIDWNGDLLGCCKTSLYTFGVNVFEQGLLKALNHPNVLYAKYMLSNSRISKKEGIPCTYCRKIQI